MATGSALPLTGGTRAGNWQPSKDLGSYDPLPASLSVPNRCGSAPPNMEGSLTGLDHLISQQSGNLEAAFRNLGCGADSSKSEELLHSDPSYFKYHNSKGNLNPRLLVSREGRYLLNRFGEAGEWRPFSLDESSSSSSSLTHRSTLSTHKEEPEDDRPPRLDSSSAEDARCDSGQSTSNIGSHSSNLVNLMQENFPQSTVLYDNCSDSSDTNSGNGRSVCSGLNSSNNSSLDIVESLDLNGFPPDTHQWSPKPSGSSLRNTLGTSSPVASPPTTSSSSDHNTIVQASQQGNSSIDIKPSGAVGAMLNGMDSSMKNLKINLDTQSSSHAMQQGQNNALPQNGPSHLVHGDPVQMIPQGIDLPQVPFVDNFSHADMRLHSGDIQLLPQIGMTTPFYTEFFWESILSKFAVSYCFDPSTWN